MLPGNIQSIQTYGNLTLVKVAVANIVITSIVIETPATANYLEIDAPAKVMFKETEVVISKTPVEISLQNRIPATILEIKTGKLLSQLKLQFQEHVFHSIITSNAVQQLSLSTGNQIVAMIKTNEIMLSD